jgi:hypothetical protein
MAPHAVEHGETAEESAPTNPPSELPIVISPSRAPMHAGCGPTPLMRSPGADGAQERATQATVCDLIPLVQHTLIQSGTSLRQHYVSMQKTLCRADPWRVFLSKRAFTALLTVNWARAIYFAVGAMIFYSDAAAYSSFEQAREVTAFKARLLRFTALQLRDGQRSSITHCGLGKVGVLRRGCEVALPHNVSHHAASLTLAFSNPVTFDGWWLETQYLGTHSEKYST